MKTKKHVNLFADWVVRYEVLESDEIGLIPKEAHAVTVTYDELNHQPDLVIFSPENKHPGLSEGETSYRRLCRRYNRQYERALYKMNNRERTPEEIRKIIARLESAVED